MPQQDLAVHNNDAVLWARSLMQMNTNFSNCCLLGDAHEKHVCIRQIDIFSVQKL